MPIPRHSACAVLAAALTLSTALPAQAGPTLEERLEVLQQEMDAIKAELAQRNGKAPAPATDRAQAAASPSAPVATAPRSESTGSSDGAAGGSGITLGDTGATRIGSYGEINFTHGRGDAGSSADAQRFVLLLGHRFNERLTFYGELEIEHAISSADDHGEVEVEQAFADYRFSDALSLKAGVFLMPLGLLNETHEPTTYHGVFRNEVETRIIPTTWREGGIGLHGEFAPGLSYDTGLVTSFDAGRFDAPAEAVRSMHQEMSLANASDVAWYGALAWRRPGLTVGTGLFTGNTGQNGASNPLLRGVGARLTLWESHLRYTAGDLELRALYARGTLRDADRVAAATGLSAPERFYGWYGEAAYRVWRKGDLELTPFVRYERYDAQASVPSGFTPDAAGRDAIATVGVGLKLHPGVVLKADYQRYRDANINRINFGVGYYFF